MTRARDCSDVPRQKSHCSQAIIIRPDLNQGITSFRFNPEQTWLAAYTEFREYFFAMLH
jgi:hypothetical protein